ncbi:MAG TPA: LysR family transcriptional regulator [Kangiella sp.]
MDFDWDDAKAFIVTAESGSLTAAAKKLRTSQPTIGRRVTSLEESLGIVLFERSKNNLFLTPQGERLLASLKGMERGANEAILVAKGATDSLGGLVTIAASQLDAVFILPTLIAKLRVLEPSLQIKLEVSNDSADLIHRNADIAIRNYRPTEENLIIRKLRDSSVSLYGTPELCTQVKAQNKAARRFPVIGFLETDYLTEVLAKGGITKEQVDFLCFSDFQLTHIELAKIGVGLALLPTNLGETLADLECVLPKGESVYDYSTWLVCHSELKQSQRIRFVFDYLAKHLTAINHNYT